MRLSRVREERNGVIGEILPILRELVRIIIEYDTKPKQKFWSESGAYLLEDGRRFQIGRDLGQEVGVRGEHRFGIGACSWSISVPRFTCAWLGVVRMNARKNRDDWDYIMEDTAYLHVDTNGPHIFSNCIKYMGGMSCVFNYSLTDGTTLRQLSHRPSRNIVFSFVVDLEKREIRMACDGIPAVAPLFTDVEDLGNMTIYACLRSNQKLREDSYITLESHDE